MKVNPVREDIGLEASQEIPHIVWTWEVHYNVL